MGVINNTLINYKKDQLEQYCEINFYTGLMILHSFLYISTDEDDIIVENSQFHTILFNMMEESVY